MVFHFGKILGLHEVFLAGVSLDNVRGQTSSGSGQVPCK